jgi:cyclopropane-fatty-acyl-phospholipid synthase
MAILDRFLERGVRRGVLEVLRPDGSLRRFGTPHEGFPEVRIRFTDDSAERRILRDPRLGAAEAYMDGQLVVEQGDIMALVELLRGNKPWDRGGTFDQVSSLKKLGSTA